METREGEPVAQSGPASSGLAVGKAKTSYLPGESKCLTWPPAGGRAS